MTTFDSWLWGTISIHEELFKSELNEKSFIFSKKSLLCWMKSFQINREFSLHLKYRFCTMPRGGMYWEIYPRGRRGMYFPMHPDSKQCMDILSALAGKYWFCGVFFIWMISLIVHWPFFRCLVLIEICGSKSSKPESQSREQSMFHEVSFVNLSFVIASCLLT